MRLGKGSLRHARAESLDDRRVARIGKDMPRSVASILALAAALLVAWPTGRSLGQPGQPDQPPTPAFPTLPPTLPFPTLPPNIPTPAPFTATATLRPGQTPTPTRVVTPEPTPTPLPPTSTPSIVIDHLAFLPYCSVAGRSTEPDAAVNQPAPAGFADIAASRVQVSNLHLRAGHTPR